MAPDRPVVAKRGGRRARSRKRRAAGAQASPQARAERAPARAATRRSAGSERPPAPWHPLPLSELFILVGAIAVVVAFTGHLEEHILLLLVGLAAVALGTFEVALREHMGGYRSHTLLLAIIPPIAFHSAVMFGLAAFIRVPRWVSLPLLVPDIAIFALLYRYLRARHLDARRERAFAGGR
jgi:hypothetical protein